MVRHFVKRSFRPTARSLGALAAVLLPAQLLMAQGQPVSLMQIPALEHGTPTVTSRLVGSQFEMRDAATNQVIVGLSNVAVANAFPAGVTNTVRLQQQPTGADLIVTVKNVTGSPKAMGRMGIGIINLGENIEYSWTRMNAEMRPANAHSHIGQAWIYPLDLYSPVMVMRNQERTVGISLNYPVMDYKHDVLLHVNSPGGFMEQGEAGRGWSVYFGFNNEGHESEFTRLAHQAMIPAGEERVYVMSIRTNSDTQNWVRTLLPYRDFFRNTYGGVQYRREDTLIAGNNLADGVYQSSANPCGYPHHLRPDVRGFGPVVREMDNTGWNNFMIWTPTGMYRNNPQLNWPFQMASQLNATPQLATAFSITEGFPWLVARGKQVGFWWGRSLEVSTQWDSPESEHFNLSNSLHVSAANRELDDAVRAGATTIGLDTFMPYRIPLWDLVSWLDQMKARHPGVEFVTEPSQCDILHVRAPTWYDGWLDIEGSTSVRSDVFNIKGPNVLSDFLNPGHESWVGLAYRPAYQRNFGRPTNTQVEADIRQLAGWGYRPTVFWGIQPPANVQFARSWEYTLPPDIRDNDPFIQNIRAGRLPGENAPAPTQSNNENSNQQPAGGSNGTPDPAPNPQPTPMVPPINNPPANNPPANNPPANNPPANEPPANTPPVVVPPPQNGNAPIVTPPEQPDAGNAPARRGSIAAQRGIRVNRLSAVSRATQTTRTANNNSGSGNSGSSGNSNNGSANAGSGSSGQNASSGPSTRRPVSRPQQNATSVRGTSIRRTGLTTVVQQQLQQQQQQTNANP
jgi:hypothetical protein